ncbi:MAG: alkaline phosphatase [Ruminococcaceae bacterium]|nr:alkaline phosphatase [Oscillospiraceae bacterium]
MLTALASIWVKLTSALLSLILSFGTMFGAFVPATTTEAAGYFDSDIKNVIYLIGDGMGFNHLEKTKQERGISLVMDTFDYQGSSMTRSITDAVTDSAAGGTALATGVRTFNGGIGVYFTDSTGALSHPKNLTELCQEAGKMTGVITTDETSGATPASFSAHSSDRGNTEDITNDQLTSGFDLIWGTENGVATKSEAEKNGFTYVTTYDEMMALEEGSRSFAQFTNTLWNLEQSDENTPNLEQMTEKAIDLLDDSDEGFFIMIEGAHIDKHSHSNEDENMTEALEEFDRAVEYALEYAKKDGETLVIVTADHETGAITLNDDGSYSFTSGSHSAANVPVLVYGTDKLIADDETLNNYEIPIRIAYILGYTEEEFPFETKVA